MAHYSFNGHRQTENWNSRSMETTHWNWSTENYQRKRNEHHCLNGKWQISKFGYRENITIEFHWNSDSLSIYKILEIILWFHLGWWEWLWFDFCFIFVCVLMYSLCLLRFSNLSKLFCVWNILFKTLHFDWENPKRNLLFICILGNDSFFAFFFFFILLLKFFTLDPTREK